MGSSSNGQNGQNRQNKQNEQIKVQTDALLVTAAGSVTLEHLNETLHPYGLWLPIVPLEQGLSLAALVARNAGGRYRLRHGTIARYLRGALIQPRAVGGTPLTVGGPTIKRATGYRLPQALVGSGQWPAGGQWEVGAIHEVTLSVRPLPPARQVALLVCPDLAAACRLAHELMQAGLSPCALAVEDAAEAEATRLLVAFEGVRPAVERQLLHLEKLATSAGATIARVEEDAPQQAASWQQWEHLAESWRGSPSAEHPPELDLSLPLAALPPFVERARALAARYSLALPMWGEAGVGTLHMRLTTPAASLRRTAEEMQQAALLIEAIARQAGGGFSTERGHHLPGTPPTPSAALTLPNHSPHRATFLEQLQAVVGPAHLITRADDLWCYAMDASIAQPGGEPLAAVLPGSTAEVAEVIRLAAHAGVPVVTRGTGSGLAGGATPSEGALLLTLTRMQAIQVDTHQRVARVEAGALTAEIQRAAEQKGLFYPPDPSSQAISTIGGNIACNAGGPRCLKYGVTADYVLALTTVMADGRTIQVGDGLTAQSPDSGLLHLLIGSEGTLAVITAATLRLMPKPATRRTTLALFERLDDACSTVEAIVAAGIIPAALELMDDTALGAVENYLQLGLPRNIEALLLLQTDGDPEAVEWESEMLTDLARRGGARDVQVARSAEEETLLWRARRSVSPSLARVRPNKLGEDICVPVPRVAEAVRRIKEISNRCGVPIPVFGHAGDGNLHPNILLDIRDPDQVARTWQAAEAIFSTALELGGTLSGEHGIGTLKRPFMAAALGSEALTLQCSIKQALDPSGLLNPGKVLPEA
jgi:glycolate oxidase subunit GlcD